MITKGRVYKFKEDGTSIILEDEVTHELESVASDSIYLFQGSKQMRLVPGVITLRPGDRIECILEKCITFGVSELYYPYEHTEVYKEQHNIIAKLFPMFSKEELDIVHKMLIPQNLRNEQITVPVLKQLTTNFVKQSLAVFTRSVYDSASNKVNREITMKLIFGVDSINTILKLLYYPLIVESNKDCICIFYLGDIIAKYEYSDIREEEVL